MSHDSEEEQLDYWDQVLMEHYNAAECGVCHQHVVEGVTGNFIPVGAGVWAVWYHYACNPTALNEYGDPFDNRSVIEDGAQRTS